MILIIKNIEAFFLSLGKIVALDWKMIQNDFVMFQNFAPIIYEQLSFKIQSIVLSNSRLFFSS